MKKYLRLVCSICNRTADRLVDNTHFVPDRCTITFRCEGRLFPIQYRSNGDITALPAPGITDWRPRGQAVSINTAAAAELVNSSTGSLQQVVLAVALATPPSDTSTVQLLLNEQADTPRAYRQYVYRYETTFSTVSGVEAGLEKKTLRYSTGDTVEVYLNGVKLVNGTGANDYQIADGVSSVPPNTISFNTEISPTGIYQVDVIVSAAVASTSTTLTFTRQTISAANARPVLGAWDNVNYVERLTTKYYLYVLDLSESTTLKLNTILTTAGSAIVTGPVPITLPTSSIKMLLARSPYSQIDRYLNVLAPLENLAGGDGYLKYHVVDGVACLELTKSSVVPTYPLLKATKFNVETTITTALAGVDDQVTVDGSVIVGPDQ